MYGDTHVSLDVCKQAVGAAIEVVSCDDLSVGLEKTCDHVQSRHP